MTILVGTIVLVDVRLLRARPEATALARLFAPWTRAGFAVMMITGPLQLFADTTRYLHNSAFRCKMACLLLALASYVTLRRAALRDGRRPRIAALVSLTLWTVVVLAARAIADFDQ